MRFVSVYFYVFFLISNANSEISSDPFDGDIIYQVKNLNINTIGEDDYEYYKPIFEAGFKKYADPLSGFFDGRFVNPDDERVVSWFINNGYKAIHLDSNQLFSDRTVYVKKVSPSFKKSDDSYLDPIVKNYESELLISYLDIGYSNLFVNLSPINSGDLNAVNLKNASLQVFKELSLESVKFKTRMKFFSTYHGLVGTYLKYTKNESGNVIAEQGAFYISSDNIINVLESGLAFPFKFEVLNLGDFDGDGQSNIIIRRQYNRKSEYLSFYEFKNNSWFLEKKIAN